MANHFIIENGIQISGSQLITQILNESDLSSNDANALATQQSIKSYVDNIEYTLNSSFQIDQDNSGPILKNNSGILELRNAADTDYNELKIGSLTVFGTFSYFESEIVTIADNILMLNSNVTGAPWEDSGIRVNRGTSPSASLIWDEDTDWWKMGIANSEIDIADISTAQTLTNKLLGSGCLNYIAPSGSEASFTGNSQLTWYLNEDNPGGDLLVFKTKASDGTETTHDIGGSSGETLEKTITQAGHGFSVGNALYFDGVNYGKADASQVDELGVFIVSEVVDASIFKVVQVGWVDGLSGLTAGNYYFVSDTTPGELTTTEATSGSSYSNPILLADSSTSGYVLPWRASTIPESNTPIQLLWSRDSNHNPTTSDFVVDPSNSNIRWPVEVMPSAATSDLYTEFAPGKTGYDYKLEIDGFMDTSESADVLFNLNYLVVSSTGDITPGSWTASVSAAYTVTGGINRFKTISSTLVIDSADITDSNDIILINFSRLGGNVNDTHGGNFNFLDVKLVPYSA